MRNPLLCTPMNNSCRMLHRAPLMLYATPAHAVRDMHHVSNYPSITKEPVRFGFDWERQPSCHAPSVSISSPREESCNIIRQPGTLETHQGLMDDRGVCEWTMPSGHQSWPPPKVSPPPPQRELIEPKPPPPPNVGKKLLPPPRPPPPPRPFFFLFFPAALPFFLG